jgi:CheY-like chemotaxis protein
LDEGVRDLIIRRAGVEPALFFLFAEFGELNFNFPRYYSSRSFIYCGPLSPKPFFIHAEDDPNGIVLIRAALRKFKAEHTLIHCPDGVALICCLRDAIISRSLPEFVLLDLRMPRATGFEALRWIRLMPELRNLPVVIFSSSAEPADVELATALGATNYIVKPLSYEKLLDEVAHILKRFGLLPLGQRALAS